MRRGIWVLVAGLLVLVAEFFFVWVPASMAHGHLDLHAVWSMSLLGLGLIAVGLFDALYVLNRRTNGAVVDVLKILGAGYATYKVGIGVARHLHQEITDHD
jgi:hypothetical protein